MSKYVAMGILGAMGATFACSLGCSALSGLIQPTSVTIQVVNEGTFPVIATFYVDDDEDIFDFLITELGTKIDNTVEAGETLTFTRICSGFGAIVLDDADLQIVGGVGPETNTDVLRKGEDFVCGDTIVFTFTHTDAILDFDVAVTVDPFSLSTGG